MTRRFFGQLLSVLENDTNKEQKAKLKKVTATISDYAAQISQASVLANFLPGVKNVKDVAALVSKILKEEQKDIHELKSKIEQALNEFDGRILIIIDDIDRLTAEEIRQLFKLVKAVADFPKITYLLAFDRKVVVSALQYLPNISGDDYLEKIVQAPFDLPSPDERMLEDLLLDELDKLFQQTSSELRKPEYWQRIYSGGLDQLLQTPRNIVRLVNALRVTYPAVSQEVISEDFVAIESLRVFHPPIYDYIRRHKSSFAGELKVGAGHNKEREELKVAYESMLENVRTEDRKAVERFLKAVFPLCESVFGEVVIHFFAEPLAHLRVAHPDAFNVYFRLGLPVHRIHHREMKAILEDAKDKQLFVNRLEQLKTTFLADGRNKAASFLSQLWEYLDESSMPLENVELIVSTLCRMGDTLGKDADIDIGELVGIALKILHKKPQPERGDIIKRAVEDSEALGTLTIVVSALEYELGKLEDGSPQYGVFPLVAEDTVESLKKLVLNKIRNAANYSADVDGTVYSVLLTQAPEFYRTLLAWERWAGEEEVREWINNFCFDDGRFAVLLSKFVYPIELERSGQSSRRIGYKFHLHALSKFVTVEDFAKRAQKLLAGQIPDDWRTTLNTFVTALESNHDEMPLDI